MKYFVGILFAFVSISVSAATQSSGVSVPQAQKKTTISHVFSRSVKKQIMVMNQTVTDDDGDEFDDIDVQVSYRRPDLVDNSQLTRAEYISLRLANARRLALEIHEKT